MPGVNPNDSDNMRNCLPHGESVVASICVAFAFLLAAVGYLGFKTYQDRSMMMRLKSEIRRLEGGELREYDRRSSMHAMTTATS